jgi:hypothetical protein
MPDYSSTRTFQLQQHTQYMTLDSYAGKESAPMRGIGYNDPATVERQFIVPTFGPSTNTFSSKSFQVRDEDSDAGYSPFGEAYPCANTVTLQPITVQRQTR